MIGLWAVLCFAGALYASWQGYGGREFAATLTVFAIYLGVMLLFAARGAAEKLSSLLRAGSGYLLGVGVFLGYLIYAVGTNSFAFARIGAVAGLVFLPIALAASAGREAMGAWQDYVTLVGVWVVVKPLPTPGDFRYHIGCGPIPAGVWRTSSPCCWR